MKKSILSAILAAIIGLISYSAIAQEAENGMVNKQQMPMPAIKRDHLFEERAGTWKATCDEMEDNKVYCRMFHIEQFGEWKAKNFIQLGPAWTPDNVGFVVATYLGFKEGSTVSIGIDKYNRHKVTAPKGNNLMMSPEIAQTIIQEMEKGHKIVITFNSHSGVRHLSLADLESYKKLLAKVKIQLAKNNQ